MYKIQAECQAILAWYVTIMFEVFQSDPEILYILNYDVICGFDRLEILLKNHNIYGYLIDMCHYISRLNNGFTIMI